jgi:uncharacterized protein (DUF433 family)
MSAAIKPGWRLFLGASFQEAPFHNAGIYAGRFHRSHENIATPSRCVGDIGFVKGRAGRYNLIMKLVERITFNPGQCGGRPCIRAMRIRVKDVLDLLAARVPESQILTDYPDLEPEDIQACIAYAAEQLDHPVLVVSR